MRDKGFGGHEILPGPSGKDGLVFGDDDDGEDEADDTA